jgi:hypothetical protein
MEFVWLPSLSYKVCIIKNNSMLLSHPWLKDVKISHDWGSSTIIIKGINMIKAIPITKKLGIYIK